MPVAENIAHIREKIAAAALRAGRNPKTIELMAVTKTVSADRIREAFDAGIRLVGENRVQEFESKIFALESLPGARFHMIGHLQSNKAARAAEVFDEIESVDSLHLARKLDAAAAEFGKKLPVLIEINIGAEVAKSGVAPDSSEMEELLAETPGLPHLEVRGLMTVPPYNDDPEPSRPYFRRIRELADTLRTRRLPAVTMDVLSMGMSHDFEIAIQEGATRVRIGTAIFGERSAMRSKI